MTCHCLPRAMFQPVGNDDFENITAYSYDELGRLQTVTAVERSNALVDIDPVAPGIQPDVTVYAYDLVGNLDTTTYSSGLIHDYDYDSLNRLEALYHWIDKADAQGYFNGIRDAHEIMAQFDYELRADGKRVGVTETFSTLIGLNGVLPFVTNVFTWQYDAAGRLISEVADSDYGFTDYTLTFAYDLAGNRLSQVKASSSSTETTVYTHDANDRLLTETITIGSITKTVAYAYHKTQQTSKVTTEPDPAFGSPLVTTQTFEYNLQGQMSKSTSTRTGGSEMGNDDNSSTTYEYDSAGNRIAATTTKVGSFGTSTTTRIEYLTDSQNPTGYSQVLTETEFAVDANGQVGAPIKQTVYTIGHDQISQTVYDDWNPITETWSLKSEAWFGTDGHGSVRVLYNAAVAVVTSSVGNKQLYHFDAYGNLLNVTMVGTPLTNYTYNGEAFDFNIGKYYFRARWYDPETGTFTSLDPFYGNSSDPQSFHKYAFVHGDPIQGIDPSGLLLATSSVTTATSISLNTTGASIAFSILLSIKAGEVITSHFAYQQLTDLARRLKTKVGSQAEIKEKEKDDKNSRYFVHGGSTNDWLNATEISVTANRRSLDFGMGFYTFKANAEGVKFANEWAFRSSGTGEGVPFLLVIKVSNTDWSNYSKQDYGTRFKPSSTYEKDVNANRDSPTPVVYGRDVVFGPTAKFSGKRWVANPKLPEQYKFETTKGVNIVAIIPAHTGMYYA